MVVLASMVVIHRHNAKCDSSRDLNLCATTKHSKVTNCEHSLSQVEKREFQHHLVAQHEGESSSADSSSTLIKRTETVMEHVHGTDFNTWGMAHHLVFTIVRKIE